MSEFVIRLRPREGSPSLTQEVIQEHCCHISKLVSEGQLIVGGPFEDNKHGGMTVGIFESIKEAELFAKNDPFVRGKYQTFEVLPWHWSRPDNGFLNTLPRAPSTYPSFLDSLHLRSTTRQFSDRPIERRLLQSILEAALCAPSEFNLQPWRPVICHDMKERKRLKKCCFNQEQVEAAGAAVICAVDPAVFLADAPISVDEFIHTGHFHAGEREDQIRFIHSYYENPRDSAIRNAVIFGHQFLLAGYSQGLAGFWLGGFDETAIHSEFKMPDRVVVAGIVGLGWPVKHKSPMPRRKSSELVSWGEWAGQE